jgi:peptide chain release factor 3
MSAVPFSWPIGMGKTFHGVYDLAEDRVRVFRPGVDRVQEGDEIIHGLDNPELRERFGAELERARHDIELVRAATPEFSRDAFVAGEQTPVFFGSAINNFGVREVLDALVDIAPPPQPRVALQGPVQPDSERFSGVVFKIQANMDPAHRDRVVFVRVCSGRFERGMKLRIQRTDK